MNDENVPDAVEFYIGNFENFHSHTEKEKKVNEKMTTKKKSLFESKVVVIYRRRADGYW